MDDRRKLQLAWALVVGLLFALIIATAPSCEWIDTHGHRSRNLSPTSPPPDTCEDDDEMRWDSHSLSDTLVFAAPPDEVFLDQEAVE